MFPRIGALLVSLQVTFYNGGTMSKTKTTLDLDAILLLDRPGLVRAWQDVFGQTAPRNAQVPLLRGLVAWQTQVAQGKDGISKELVKTLRNWSAVAPVASLEPGTCLVREWQGRTYHVQVLDQGFEHEGVTYKSLTAITRKITGMGWSGPQFFGLRK